MTDQVNEVPEVFNGDQAEDSAARLYERVGVFKANQMNRKFLDVTSAGVLKQIKESRSYADEGLSWNDFCNAKLGISRPTADEMIDNLEIFGAEFLQSAHDLKISRRLLQGVKALPEGERENVRRLIADGRVDEVEELIAEREAEKDIEIRGLRQDGEKVRSDKFKVEAELGKVENELQQANEVIARKEYRMTQLANDAQEFAKFEAEFQVKCLNVFGHLEQTEFRRLTPAQKSNIYNDILEHRDTLNRELEDLSMANPDIFDIVPQTKASFEELAEGAETFPINTQDN